MKGKNIERVITPICYILVTVIIYLGPLARTVVWGSFLYMIGYKG